MKFTNGLISDERLFESESKNKFLQILGNFKTKINMDNDDQLSWGGYSEEEVDLESAKMNSNKGFRFIKICKIRFVWLIHFFSFFL